MSTLLNEAVALDLEAVKLSSQLQSTFVHIGRVMDRMTDDRELWRLLRHPNGENYRSQEDWVSHRFREQRATAFEARRLYRSLHQQIPDGVMEQIPSGSLKILAQLPESAQRNLDIQELAVMHTPAEFTAEAITRFPKHFIDTKTKWELRPTMAQAANYNRLFDVVLKWYSAETQEPITRENAFELLLMDFERSVQEQAMAILEKQTKGATIQ